MAQHIAIIGTEGSGKTILATVWARRLAYSNADNLFLSDKNTDTEKYVDQAWQTLNKGEWPLSTPPGTQTELDWDLNYADIKYPIKLLDLPGQDLRNFFNDRYDTLSTDKQALFNYVSSASLVIAVVNLERIVKNPGSDDRFVLSAIVRFLEQNAESQHLYFVFTAWDKVAATILEKYGSLMEYIRKELTPFHNRCKEAWKQEGKGIYFLAVAPVAQIVYDVKQQKYVPKKDFKSYNLGNLTKVLVQSLAALQHGDSQPDWDEEIVHPYDEQLFNEWYKREWWKNTRKNLWKNFKRLLSECCKLEWRKKVRNNFWKSTKQLFDRLCGSREKLLKNVLVPMAVLVTFVMVLGAAVWVAYHPNREQSPLPQPPPKITAESNDTSQLTEQTSEEVIVTGEDNTPSVPPTIPIIPTELPPEQSRLGVRVAVNNNGIGVRITDVRNGSAGHQAGLQPDDIILLINDKRLSSLQDYFDADSNATGDSLILIVHKADSGKTIEFTLDFRKNE